MLYAEDDYDLYLAPRMAEYSPHKGGTSRHLMVNGTPDRMAIKVKCSNNQVYRVSPVYTCLEPGCSQRLQVIRDPGEPKVDKLIILYKKTTCKNALEAFHQPPDDDSEVKKALIALVSLKHRGHVNSESKSNSEVSNPSEQSKVIDGTNGTARTNGTDGMNGKQFKKVPPKKDKKVKLSLKAA